MTECIHTSLQGAIFWSKLGYSPIPVQFRSKKPYNPEDPDGKGWPGLRITAANAPQYFDRTPSNIGVLLGDEQGSADVDLDCQEAILLAKHFLPDTGIKFGRSSKRASHWFYRVDPPIPSEALVDPIDGKTLLELRCRKKDGSIGFQTVVPPSTYENGEQIDFEPGFNQHPANVDAAPLIEAVRTVGAAALLAKHWPAANSGRHVSMLALAGVLQRARWHVERAVGFCLAFYQVMPDHDKGAIQRTESEVRDTFHAAAEGRAATGIPTLSNHLDKRVLQKVLSWLEIEPQADWQSGIILGRQGNPKALLANAVAALGSHPEWIGVLVYDEFSLTVEARKPTPWGMTGDWTDHEDILATEWLQRGCGIHVPVGVTAEAVQAVAKRACFDPLREYLCGLKWDGVPRTGSWLPTYLGVEASPYVLAVGARWLISAVARALKPGCKADCMLILEGKQGSLKSTVLEILAGPWFTDELSELGSKDASMQLLGVWIVEIAELDSMTRVEVSRVKAFLSRKVDRFRPPYGRRLTEWPRRCIFAGTVNGSDYLRDETGNRRMWPVTCTHVRLEELRRDRDQIWAEAVNQYRHGVNWWLDSPSLVELAEEQQADRMQPDTWQEAIHGFISTREDVSVSEVLSNCIMKDRGQWGKGDEMRVGRILRSSGWIRYKQRIAGGGNGTAWRYRLPGVIE